MVMKSYVVGNLEVITYREKFRDCQAASNIRREHSVINFIARLEELPPRN